MFKQTIVIITFLSLSCFTVVTGCKEMRYELTDIRKMPVVIKFTIPNSLIANSQTDSVQDFKILLKVQQYFPEVSNLRLFAFEKISKTDYYEYYGERKGKIVSIFVFDKSGEIAISGLESVERLEQQSRYELTDKGINIYKKFIVDGKQGLTVSVFYQYDSGRISFGRDDGFSVW